ncbi:alpha/beta hydrolase [Altererythrobacter aquiaggeris]|uniref:alpha/beta hydrolase n=1 Tax=Aestuarierythrobacter aquiaggeris TaxID=1898396 RepID=UPI003016CB6E
MAENEPYIRDEVRAFLDTLAAMNGPAITEMSLEEARMAYAALHAMADRPARDLAVIRDAICPGPAGEIPLRIYDARETREAGPVVMFYHGGGFVIGDLETHHNLCTELAAEFDLPVVAVDYRLAPEHPYPAAVDDAEAATRWVAASPAELGSTCTGLITFGDSAGGNLAIVVPQALVAQPANVPVLVQVAVYPLASDVADAESIKHFADGYVLTALAVDFFDRAYAGDKNDSRTLPILGDLSASPPTIVATASLDPIRDSGRDYTAALKEHGVDVEFLEMEGMTHSFLNLRQALPSAQDDTVRVIAATKAMLEKYS